MVTLLLVSPFDDEKIHKKYTRFADHFEVHADAPVQSGTHLQMDNDQGFPWSHWMLPLGNYLYRIAPASPPWSLTAATPKKSF